ncbi:MAG: hypothetical protein HC831_18060 [Chloroflexia bacterium]|nr:hypothetical protein [Chloroflexia bacterium]
MLAHDAGAGKTRRVMEKIAKHIKNIEIAKANSQELFKDEEFEKLKIDWFAYNDDNIESVHEFFKKRGIKNTKSIW